MATTQAATDRERLLGGLPVAERRLELAGVSTAVLEGGDGPPLVLLHGPAGNATHWMRAIPGLVAAHRVIAPDLPGHGASAVVAGGDLDARRALDWLDALIERTCSSPPALVGYALGGALAARFAAGRGDRLSRLVLVDALGLTAFAPAPEFAGAIGAFLAQPDQRTHDGLWRHCAHDLDRLRRRMGDDWAPFEAYNIDRARTPSVAAAVHGLLTDVGGPAIPPEDLARIAVPTTLVWGRHDAATPLPVAQAAAARHGWALRVIEDCADDPPLEQPEAFVRTLRAALGEPPARPRADDRQTRALAAAGFGGEVVGRGDPRYDELRAVFNAMIDRRPALIARCADADDVAVAVGFARERGLPLSVYGGGHNVTGNAVGDDGVVDRPAADEGRPRRSRGADGRAEAGLTWGEMDAATQDHGLAVTGGRMSDTGIGGLVLGGGSGWIERKYGYAVDNLLSVEVVTADGRILTASEDENPDLFWGLARRRRQLRRRHALRVPAAPDRPDRARPACSCTRPRWRPRCCANFRDVMADAPDEVGAGVALLTAPPEEFVPEPVRGRPVVGVILCYAGPARGGRGGPAAAARVRPAGARPGGADAVHRRPAARRSELPAGMRNYWNGDFLAGLPDEAIEILCRFHLSKPSAADPDPHASRRRRGARVPDGAMAIGQREAPFNIHITSLWADGARTTANIAWTRESAPR